MIYKKNLAVSAPWILLALLAAGTLAFRLQLSFDLSAFFPGHGDLYEKVLLQQLSNGPGSRLLVAGISGAPSEELALLSDEMRATLSGDPIFANVLNGEFSEDADGASDMLTRYALLLDDPDFSTEGLTAAIQQRVQDLSFGGGSFLLDMVSRDPYLSTLRILEQLAPVDMDGEMWFSESGAAVLMLETHARATELSSQALAVARISSVFHELAARDSLRLNITGVGAFGVELQSAIRSEAAFRSVLASAALALVLLAFYRRFALIVLAALPLSLGFLCGLAVLSVVFTSVHGITLAFGFTLLGIAIDYPLHLFSHAARRPPADAVRAIWPTMRLGAISTIIAYLALVFSGSEGLAQLGVFTATGVAIAAAATRWWLPALLPTASAPQEAVQKMQTGEPRYLPAAVVLIASLLLFALRPGEMFWNDSLASLSPVPSQRLAEDQDFRSASGSPDLRYQLMISQPELEILLQQGERLDQHLNEAIAAGELEGFQSITQIVGSEMTHRARQRRIPPRDVLEPRIAKAVEHTPFRSDAFTGFLDNAAAARNLPALTPALLDETPLKTWSEAHYLWESGQHVSLVTLRNPDMARLRTRIGASGEDVAVIDLSASMTRMMQGYRQGALGTLAVAALLILGLCWMARGATNVVWIAVTVIGALSASIAAILLAHGSLTVIHLVALLLVLGLGLDYALFVSRPETRNEARSTRRALLACALSTSLAFTVLAFSSIPVLKFLGLTVAAGSAASLLLAITGISKSRSVKR